VGPRVKRLGVIGTMVWDTIYGRHATTEPVTEWGGIAYALAALEVALADDWEVVPLIKVGRDMAPQANEFLQGLTRRAGAARFIEVPEANNRVTLRYESMQRRTEQLRGGVPGWQWSELGPMIGDLDALYVNFISGFELDLDSAVLMRRGFAGPIYADLHSLLLGVTQDGRRVPARLADPAAWFSCFDAVQLNEEEMGQIGADAMEIAAVAMTAGVRLLVVTLGGGGAVYFTTRPYSFDRRHGPAVGPVETARVPPPDPQTVGDTTGCGDVFGATLVGHLLSGRSLDDGLDRANRLAGRNVRHHGATNLHYYLRGEIAPT